jgi:uncharacterized membrane protein
MMSTRRWLIPLALALVSGAVLFVVSAQLAEPFQKAVGLSHEIRWHHVPLVAWVSLVFGAVWVIAFAFFKAAIDMLAEQIKALPIFRAGN